MVAMGVPSAFVQEMLGKGEPRDWQMISVPANRNKNINFHLKDTITFSTRLPSFFVVFKRHLERFMFF